MTFPSARSIIWILTALLVAACQPGDDLLPLPDPPAGSYQLGAGDQVRIITFGEERLTGEFRVNDRGNIALPLVGPVRAAGLNSSGLEAAVAVALKRAQLLRDPSIAVEVIAYRPVFVLGEVNKPGEFPWQPGMTVVTAVAVAGGFTYRAISDYASVVRTVGVTAVEGKVWRQSYLQPGDVVTIFERRF